MTHAGDVFPGNGGRLWEPPLTPSRGLKRDSGLRLGPHHLCSVSALRFCDLSTCDENLGHSHSPYRIGKVLVFSSLLMPAVNSLEKSAILVATLSPEGHWEVAAANAPTRKREVDIISISQMWKLRLSRN